MHDSLDEDLMHTSSPFKSAVEKYEFEIFNVDNKVLVEKKTICIYTIWYIWFITNSNITSCNLDLEMHQEFETKVTY